MALTVGHITPRSALAVDGAALLGRAERAIKRARKMGEPVLLGQQVRRVADALAARAHDPAWRPDAAVAATLACAAALELAHAI